MVKQSRKNGLQRELLMLKNQARQVKLALEAHPRRMSNQELATLTAGLDITIQGIIDGYAVHRKQENPAEFIQFVFGMDLRMVDYLFDRFPSLSRGSMPHMSSGRLSSQSLPKLSKHIYCNVEIRDDLLGLFPEACAQANISSDRLMKIFNWSALMHRLRDRSLEEVKKTPEFLRELRRESEIICATAVERRKPFPKPRTDDYSKYSIEDNSAKRGDVGTHRANASSDQRSDDDVTGNLQDSGVVQEPHPQLSQPPARGRGRPASRVATGARVARPVELVRPSFPSAAALQKIKHRQIS
jgi:hypothetical protein